MRRAWFVLLVTGLLSMVGGDLLSATSEVTHSLCPRQGGDGVGILFLYPGGNAFSCAFAHRVGLKLDKSPDIAVYGFLTSSGGKPILTPFYTKRYIPFRCANAASGSMDPGLVQRYLSDCAAKVASSAGAPGGQILAILEGWRPIGCIQCGVVCIWTTKSTGEGPPTVRVAVFDPKAKTAATASASGRASWTAVTTAEVDVSPSARVKPDEFVCPDSIVAFSAEDLVVSEKVACGLILRCLAKLADRTEIASPQGLEAAMAAYAEPTPAREAYGIWGQGLVTTETSAAVRLFREAIAHDERFPNPRLSLAIALTDEAEKRQAIDDLLALWPSFHLKLNDDEVVSFSRGATETPKSAASRVGALPEERAEQSALTLAGIAEGNPKIAILKQGEACYFAGIGDSVGGYVVKLIGANEVMLVDSQGEMVLQIGESQAVRARAAPSVSEQQTEGMSDAEAETRQIQMQSAASIPRPEGNAHGAFGESVAASSKPSAVGGIALVDGQIDIQLSGAVMGVGYDILGFPPDPEDYPSVVHGAPLVTAHNGQRRTAYITPGPLQPITSKRLLGAYFTGSILCATDTPLQEQVLQHLERTENPYMRRPESEWQEIRHMLAELSQLTVGSVCTARKLDARVTEYTTEGLQDGRILVVLWSPAAGLLVPLCSSSLLPAPVTQ